MSRVREFFVQEATECLETADTALEDGSAEAAYGAVRRFRGSAQMARFGTLARRALALELRLRETPERGLAEARDVLPSLREEVEAVREGRRNPDAEAPAPTDPTSHSSSRPAGGRVAGEAEVEDEVVPLEALEYSGEAALDRALELRSTLEDALVADEPVGPVLDELFDLIRLAKP